MRASSVLLATYRLQPRCCETAKGRCGNPIARCGDCYAVFYTARNDISVSGKVANG
ncbi:MAG: hypothetical protein IKI11_01190 [Neisseriaceae bacterium]|nr:hypothetical protein [Neisseriaceae bacterium]